ncbi:MAG: T9SS type A sorting domain-containing protein [Bacteroidia bacterium]|jgi:hypothetical protein|nr:T9SS type A sorting domain-containing protein [Bacteroidia bacterium]MBP7262487.1 T9SS type A sorting domain-containing protein [Bacteroidia bacterium]MBP9181275.1 T9SS type A sorting domain-containing protein [Bacteroidia bacterium]MBP9725160.1 T9SS type A sorting domain-containing protein [Bacteroidia bacterium]
MKKILLAVVFLVTAVAAFSQCTPDAGITYSGIYPRNLPNGQEGVPYNQVIQFKVPKDTTGFTVDSLYILSIAGGPAGMNYQCNKPTCGYKGNANGCAVLTAPLGAGSAGMYTLNVSVMVKLKSPIPFVPPVTRTFSNTLDLVVDQPVGVEDILAGRGNQGLVLYPNPASRMVNVSIQAERSQQTLLTLLDMHGRVVKQARVNVNNGSNTVTLSLDGVPHGLYLVATRVNGIILRARLLVQ